jgi:hypothetical protein
LEFHRQRKKLDCANLVLIFATFKTFDMRKSDIHPMPQFFDRYINKVSDIPVVEALEQYPSIESAIDKHVLEALGDNVYAPGKWTIKDIVQHITDNERVQAYRAMRISRNDQTVLPGYDENLFADNTNAANISLDDLLEEFAITRQSNIMLFKSFTDEMLQRTGTCYTVSISPLALGFVLAGHQLHHINIINERYLPLLG